MRQQKEESFSVIFQPLLLWGLVLIAEADSISTVRRTTFRARYGMFWKYYERRTRHLLSLIHI